MPRPYWIKFWTEEWLDGSIRVQLTAEERSVWADLLALAGRSRNPGVIQSNNGVAYPHSYLAGRFRVPIELLEVSLKKFVEQARISENTHGITILNWEKYQSLRKPREPESNEADKIDKYVKGKYGEHVKR
jgi:hypothetical protein